MRQLSRRVPRQDVGTRQSMHSSEAAMLTPADDRLSSQWDGSRARSLSGSSALLLGRTTASDGRTSAMESGSGNGAVSIHANNSSLYSPTTSRGAYPTAGSSTPQSGQFFTGPSYDPYYRPPRPRKKTMDTEGSNDTRPGASTTPRTPHFAEAAPATPTADDTEGPVNRSTPMPAYIPAPKDDLDLDDTRPPRKDKDYAVREVDFYYHVRGPPLSHIGTRKLKTGPADPTGPVSSATGWFRNLFMGKTKEKGKGFEVVRSTRAPPQGLFTESEEFHEPYRDDPEGGSGSANLPSPAAAASHHHLRGPEGGDDGNSSSNTSGNEHSDIYSPHHSHGEAPTLPPFDPSGGIELPSRMGSQHSSHAPSVTISRHNSTRQSSMASSGGGDMYHALGPVAEAASNEPRDPSDPEGLSALAAAQQLQPSIGTGRLPFSATSSPSRDRDYSVASTAPSTSSSYRVDANPNDGNNTTTATTVPRTRVERPSSMGYVTSHRAQDHIHQPSTDQMSLTGSAAEWVDEDPEH